MSTRVLDTAALESAAAAIDSINRKLMDTLSESRANVQSLSSVWSGQASEAAISAFNAFEAKYSQQYREMLEKYSAFLKETAGKGVKREQDGVKLSDTI